VGAVLFIAAFFPYYQVNSASKPYSAKVAASLLSPVSFGLGEWPPSAAQPCRSLHLPP